MKLQRTQTPVHTDSIKSDTFPVETDLAADRMEELMAYITAHRSDPLRLPDLAGRLFITPNYLAAVFKKYSGETVMEYAEEQRMICAKDELEHTHNRISKITVDCGYSSESYFSKVFKKHYHLTPRQWRNLCIQASIHHLIQASHSQSQSAVSP